MAIMYIIKMYIYDVTHACQGQKKSSSPSILHNNPDYGYYIYIILYTADPLHFIEFKNKIMNIVFQIGIQLYET